MGRKKISIATIQDDRLRNITFNKRKSGLLKKAAELSMLCNIQVCLAFTDVYGNLINFYSPDASVAQEFSKTHPYKKVYTFTRDDYPNFFGMRNKKKQSDIKKEDGEESQMDQIDESENGEDDDEEMSHNSKISEINSVSKKSNHRNNEINSTNNLAVKAKPQPKKQLKISVPENKIVIQSMNVLKSTFMEGGQAAPNQATNVTSDSNKNQLLINQQQQYHIVPSQNQAGLTNMQSNIMGGNQNFQSSMIHQAQKGSSGNNIENPQNSNMGNILNQQLLAQNTIQGMKMQEDMKQQLQQFVVSGGGINQQSIMNQNLIKNMQSELNSVSQNPFDILNTLQQADPSSAVMGNTQNFLNNQLYSNSNNFMNLAQQVSPQFANNSILQNQQQSFDMYNAQQQNQQQQNVNQNQQQSINAQQQQQQSNQVNQSQQQQQQQQQNQQAAQQQQLKKSFRPSSKSGLNSNNGLLFQSSNNQGFLEQLLLHQYQQPSISNQALQQRITSNSHNFLVPKSGNFQNPTSNPSIFNFINGKINESPHIDKIKTSLPTYNTSNPFLNASLFSGNNFNKTYLELNSLTPALNQDESLNIMSQQYQPFSMQNQLSQSFQKQVGNQLEQEMQQNQNGQQNYQGSSINSVLLQNQNQHQGLHNQQPQSQNQILINPNQTNMNSNNNNKSNNMNIQNNNNNNSLLQPGMNNQQNQQQILNSHFYQQQQPMQNLLTKHEEAMNNNLLNGANTKYIVHEGGENKTQNINLSHPAHNNILQANQNDSKMQ